MNRYIITLLTSFLLLSACSKEKSGKYQVTVSILPQKYLVERIAGSSVAVNVMIPPGQSPATYEPTPRQIRAAAHSRIYFRIGHIPFEHSYMRNITALNKNMKVVDVSRGVNLIRAPERRGHTGHGHRGIDPHIWLSPPEAKTIAGNTHGALSQTFPELQKQFTANYKALLLDIDRLHSSITARLKKSKGRKFMVFHPTWSYFARDYGLVQVPIEREGKSPDPVDIKNLIDTARQNNIKILFVQKQFPARYAEAIARDIDGRVVSLDPLAPDWLENMKRMTTAIQDAL